MDRSWVARQDRFKNRSCGITQNGDPSQEVLIGRVSPTGKVVFTKVSQATEPLAVTGLAPLGDDFAVVGRQLAGANSIGTWFAAVAGDGAVKWQLAGAKNDPIAGFAGVGRRDKETVWTVGEREVNKLHRLVVEHHGSLGGALGRTEHGQNAVSLTPASHRPIATWPDGSSVLLALADDGKTKSAWVVRRDAAEHTSCGAAGGCIAKSPADCADNNPCTIDACDGGGGCSHKPVIDGAICSPTAVCKAGKCGF